MATLSDCHGFNPADRPSKAEESIINRKREHKGLPSSFSSNLNRSRASPPRTTRERGATQGSTGGNSSVKAIVAWLESSKSSQQTTLVSAGDDESAKSKLSLRTSSPTHTTAAPLAPQTIQTSPDVEEYSLTLLKYRQYFTATPLGRCLDERDGSSQHKGGNANSAKGPAQACQKGAPTEPEETEEGKFSGDYDATTVRRELSTPSCDDDPFAAKFFKRDSREVADFWNQVRSYLWISDDELDDQPNTKSFKGKLVETSAVENQTGAPLPQDAPVTSHVQTTDGSLPSSTRTHSNPHEIPSRNQRYRRRRLPQSTEEKVSKIDAFLAEDGTISPVKSAEAAGPCVMDSVDSHSPNIVQHGKKETRSNPVEEPTALRCTPRDKAKQVVECSPASRSSSRSSRRPPPPRSRSVVSSSSSKLRVAEPPIRDGSDEEWNFF